MWKSPRLREGFSEGEGPGVPKRWGLIPLLRLLIGHGSSGVDRELLQVVLQQADFDAASADALRFRSVIGGSRGVAHAYQVNAEDRDVMVQNQVADHRLGHLLRSLDRR